jgi:hypothetical protein
MECGSEARNYGFFMSPEECAAVAFNDGCRNFMFSDDHPEWECRCCAKGIDHWVKDPESHWDVHGVM